MISRLRISDRVRQAQYGIYLIVALGLVIRLVGLGWHSLWFDEAREYSRAAGSLRDAILGLRTDGDPPLFSILHHYWLKFSTGQTFIRLPAALFGTGAIYLGYVWANATFGSGIGILTALLLALAPVQVYYSQEMNQYSLVVLLSIATLIAFERLLAGCRVSDWVIYATVSLFDLFTYYGLAFLLLGLSLYLVHRILKSVIAAASWKERGRLLLMPAIYGLLLTVITLLLWKIRLFDQVGVIPFGRRFHSASLIREWNYLATVAWNHILVFFILPFSRGPAWWVVRATTVLAIAGAVYLLRRTPSGPRALGSGFAIPLISMYVASGFGLYPFGFRYLLFLSPIFFAAVAAGLWLILRANRGLGITAVVSLCVIFLLFSPHGLWANPWLSLPREEAGPVIAYLERRMHPDDAIYVYYGARPAFSYYYRGSRTNVTKGTWFRSAKPQVKSAEMLAALRGRKRIWLVMSHIYPGEHKQLPDLLRAASLRQVDRFHRVNATAFLFERR